MINRREIRKIIEAVFQEKEPFLNMKKAADYMGVTNDWLSRHDEIPRVKRGKLLYFKRSDLDKWITQYS